MGVLALDKAHIFSIWFCAGSSVQPICMYELGRHLALHQLTNYKFGHRFDKIVIGIEPGYLREQDVRIQTGLVSKSLARRITSSLEEHAKAISEALDLLPSD